MKTLFKSILVYLVITVAVFGNGFSQTEIEVKEEIAPRKWSIEFRAGTMNPISPMSNGASTSLSSNLFNHLGFGFRYMFGDILGLRVGGYFDNLRNGTDSRKFHTSLLSGSIQGIADIGKYIKITSPTSYFKLQGHFGIFVSKHSVLHDVPPANPLGQPIQNTSEGDGGFKFGILPEFFLGKGFLLSFDLNLDVSFRRNMAWDGLSWDGEKINKLTGSKWNFSIGLVSILK